MNVVEIHQAVEALAASIEEQSSIVRVWALSNLAHRTGLEVVVFDRADPVEVMASTWTDTIAQLLVDELGRHGDIGLAARAVIDRLLEGRGL